MNLVKMLEEQLSGDAIKKLSSQIGADPESTGRAASAAVPTLLASLAKLASNDDGVRKLTGVLGGFDSNSFGNFTQALGGDSGALLSKGMGALGTLFGGNILSNIAAAISRYAGIDPAIVQKVLAFVAPLVLGKVASQWKSQGGTPAALTNMLNEQTRYIPDSLPPGFSLDQIPGLSGATETVRAATQTTRRAVETAGRAAPSTASWLLPLAAAIAGAFLLWYFLKPRPEAPPVAARDASTEAEPVTAMKPALPDMPEIPSLSQATEQLKSTMNTFNETLTSIKDAASAEAAAPKLEELSAKIDSMKMAVAQLPETGRTTLQTVVNEGLGPLKEQAQQTQSLPGLSERIKQLITQNVRKLEEWKIVETTG